MSAPTSGTIRGQAGATTCMSAIVRGIEAVPPPKWLLIGFFVLLTVLASCTPRDAVSEERVVELIRQHSPTPQVVVGPKGDPGDSGAQGLRGPQGPEGPPGPSATQVVESLPAEIVNRYSPGVVAVQSGNSWGTAFVIHTAVDASTLLLTARHTVEGDSQVTLHTLGGQQLPATVVAANRTYDTALLLTCCNADLPVLPVAEWPTPDHTWLLSIAHYQPGELTVSTGRAVTSQTLRDGVETVWHDTDGFGSGYSGSPILNQFGFVIGWNVREYEGMGVVVLFTGDVKDLIEEWVRGVN